MNALFWLRTDLRLLDNAALLAALEDGPVIAAFMLSPKQWLSHEDAPVKVDFWLRNLAVLAEELERLNIPLKVIDAPDWSLAPAALEAFCRAHDIASVHANAEWGVNERERDVAVSGRLAERGIAWTTHHGATLFVPGSVLTGKGECYRVFTPFAKRCRELLRTAPIAALPAPRAQGPLSIGSDPIPEAVAGFERPRPEVATAWGAGSQAAFERLDAFADGAIAHYEHDRDIPSLDGTSRLSPYLAAGVLSPGQALRAALSINHGELDSGKLGVRTWITELLWREFYQHLLAATPSLSRHQPMREETRRVAWREAPDELHAWQQGQTGIPIIDAAMRQLLATGWMHNRLRMLTAMFLAKNLLIDWRRGEAWFMRHLVDGDLAANNGGWQWSASTGADSVPYFRVFNPLTQSQKFDPDGIFLARWLPELASLPGPARHEPTEAQRRAAGYPDAIVDLGQTRRRAIDAFRHVK
jgi:deoxyribodipyrimidine photo-lyase